MVGGWVGGWGVGGWVGGSLSTSCACGCVCARVRVRGEGEGGTVWGLWDFHSLEVAFQITSRATLLKRRER